MDETSGDNEDEEKDVEDEDEEGDDGENDSGEEDDGNDGDDGDDEDDEESNIDGLIIPEGFVLCHDSEDSVHIIRMPLPILKTRLRFKLLTLLRAGYDPNGLDSGGISLATMRDIMVWAEWTRALLKSGFIFNEDSNGWARRLKEEVSFG